MISYPSHVVKVTRQQNSPKKLGAFVQCPSPGGRTGRTKDSGKTEAAPVVDRSSEKHFFAVEEEVSANDILHRRRRKAILDGNVQMPRENAL